MPIYARDDAEAKGRRDALYGSISAGETVKLENQAEVYHRPGSSALTRLIWDN